MVIAVLKDDATDKDFVAQQLSGNEIIWADSLRSLLVIEADQYIDLQFIPDPGRIAALQKLLPKKVLVRDRLLPDETGDWKLRDLNQAHRPGHAPATPARLLIIDTALETARVCISLNDTVLVSRENGKQVEHASWVHMAISELLNEAGIQTADIDGIGVNAGPGSYTGLRVGMATAKGLCYALGVPLITISSLNLIAAGVRRTMQEAETAVALPLLICPMIDARRMEVFTALYTAELEEKMAPLAILLEPDTFTAELDTHTVVFCGNGSEKFKPVCQHPNAVFRSPLYSSGDLATAGWKRFANAEFSDLAYSEPAYIKEFFTDNSRDLNKLNQERGRSFKN